ncbi:hypothetical protein [Streptomyces sp. NPDC055005]
MATSATHEHQRPHRAPQTWWVLGGRRSLLRWWRFVLLWWWFVLRWLWLWLWLILR